MQSCLLRSPEEPESGPAVEPCGSSWNIMFHMFQVPWTTMCQSCGTRAISAEILDWSCSCFPRSS